MTKSAPRQTWIDCVRGIGIILVVLGHYDQGVNPLCRWISSFHMPLFFILSGILVAMHGAYEGKPLRGVLVRKAKQLFYPFAAFSLLVILSCLLRSQPAMAARVAYYTVTLEGHSVLWFLPALWMAECMLLVLLRSKIPDHLGTAAIIAGTSVYAALQYYAIGGAVPADEGLHYLILNGLCRAGIGFVFMMIGYKGYLMRGRFAAVQTGRLRLFALLTFALGCLFGFINGMPDLHFSVQRNPLLYYLAALMQSGGLIVFIAVTLPKNAMLEFFGRNSLVIMATHYPLPVINLVQFLMAHALTGMRYADDLIGCAVVMAVETIIILMINRFFPFLLRMPALKRGRHGA